MSGKSVLEKKKKKKKKKEKNVNRVRAKSTVVNATGCRLVEQTGSGQRAAPQRSATHRDCALRDGITRAKSNGKIGIQAGMQLVKHYCKKNTVI